MVGVVPTPGPQLIDGDFVNGIAAGRNATNADNLTAAGTTQATAAVVPPNNKLVRVGTTAASTGIALPSALKGTEIKIYNGGANTLTVYPAVANNPVTAAQDTINGSTSITAATVTSLSFFCPKDGVWATTA